jgi:hypothetical protein
LKLHNHPKKLTLLIAIVEEVTRKIIHTVTPRHASMQLYVLVHVILAQRVVQAIVSAKAVITHWANVY